MINYFGFVYQWIDSSNGKTYIGSHKGLIEDGYIGSGTLFIRAYKKRPEKFQREILEYIYNKDILLEIEQKYLDKIDWDNTYNISAGANGGNMIAGMTKEQKLQRSYKISKGNKGKPKSKESNEKRSKSLKGKSKTESHIKNMSRSLKGRKLSEAHKRKLSEIKQGQKRGSYNKGSKDD